MDEMKFSLAQNFEIEKMNRVIDGTADIGALKQLCKQLLQAWMTQKSATNWAMRQSLSRPPSVRELDHG